MPPSQKQKPSSKHYQRFSDSLEAQKTRHLHRSLLLTAPSVLFSSNDYLGLSKHPKIIQAVTETLKIVGFGSGSARTFATHLPFYRELEETLANYLGKESSLLFSSGYQLNSTLLKALAKEDTLFFLDKYCHRSLLEGAYNSGGEVFRFSHNDPEHLEELLEKHRTKGKEAWIISESLFSMHGTRGDLKPLIDLKNRYNAFLIVDEAHSIGIIDYDREEIDLVVGGFGKALGGFGGFVAGDTILIDYLLNFSPGFLFTTALPPSIVAGLIQALKLLPNLDSERERLYKNCRLLRANLGLLEGDYIVPFPVTSPEKALFFSNILQENSFQVPAVRPPTVPPKGSILRFSLSANHTEAEINNVSRLLIELTKDEK